MESKITNGTRHQVTYAGEAFDLRVKVYFYKKKFLRRKRLFFTVDFHKAFSYSQHKSIYLGAAFEVTKRANLTPIYKEAYKIKIYPDITYKYSPLKKRKSYPDIHHKLSLLIGKATKINTVTSLNKFTESIDKAIEKFEDRCNKVLDGKYNKSIPKEFTE